MRTASSLISFLIAAFVPIAAAHADCSGLVSPSQDKCLQLELGLAEDAVQGAYETLLSRLDSPARSALQAEELRRKEDQRPCLALERIHRAYSAAEKNAASICISDMQDQASALVEWLVAVELERPRSGIIPPQEGWQPADYRLVGRSGSRFLIIIWTTDPGDVCADGMLTLMRPGNGAAAWEQMGGARRITIECPRFGGLIAPDRPDYPDFSITGEIDTRRTPITRYFKLSQAGLSPFPLDGGYLGSDSPQFTAVPRDEDPIVWVWASGGSLDGPCDACTVQIPTYYRLRAGKLIEACGEQADAYRAMIRDAAEDRKGVVTSFFARLQLGDIEPAVARLHGGVAPEAEVRLIKETRQTWPEAQIHDCRLAGFLGASRHIRLSGLAD